MSLSGFVKLLHVIIGNGQGEGSITLKVKNGATSYTAEHEKSRRATVVKSAATTASKCVRRSKKDDIVCPSDFHVDHSDKHYDESKITEESEEHDDESSEAKPEGEKKLKGSANNELLTIAHYLTLAERILSGFRLCYLAPTHPHSQLYGKVLAKTAEQLTVLAKEFVEYGSKALNQTSHTLSEEGTPGEYRREFIAALETQRNMSRSKRNCSGELLPASSQHAKVLSLFASGSSVVGHRLLTAYVSAHKKVTATLYPIRVKKFVEGEVLELQKVLSEISWNNRTLSPQKSINHIPLKKPGEFDNICINGLDRCIMTRNSSGYSSHESLVYSVQELVKRVRASRRTNVNILLILDFFSAHRSPKFRSELEKLDISYLFVPAGMTSELQPLDLTFNDKLKHHIRAILDERRHRAIVAGVNNFPMSSQAASVAANDARIQIVMQALSRIPRVCISKGFQMSMDNAADYFKSDTSESDSSEIEDNSDSELSSDDDTLQSVSILAQSVARKAAVERLISTLSIKDARDILSKSK